MAKPYDSSSLFVEDFRRMAGVHALTESAVKSKLKGLKGKTDGLVNDYDQFINWIAKSGGDLALADKIRAQQGKLMDIEGELLRLHMRTK